MARKRVLVANDDGIFADGLLAIARELHATGEYDVRVFAPAKQNSGVSHAITIWTSLYVEEYKLPDELQHIPAFRVEGTPADCVKVALTGILTDWKPDIVVSGINFGLNVGQSVLYSGTVGAAQEAALYGFPSIALSLDLTEHSVLDETGSKHDPSGWWKSAAELSLPVIREVLNYPNYPPGITINVNIPNLPKSQVLGYKWTKQGNASYEERFVEVPNDQPSLGAIRRKFRLAGKLISNEDNTFDHQAVKEGWVSITPLGLLFQSENFHQVMQKLFSAIVIEHKT